MALAILIYAVEEIRNKRANFIRAQVEFRLIVKSVFS